MAWELENDEYIKAQRIHRLNYVNRSHVDEDGKPARVQRVIRLGMGLDGTTCHHCNQAVKLDAIIKDGGTLHRHTGEWDGNEPVYKETSVAEIVKEDIVRLTEHDARIDAYAAKHKATVYRGPK